MKIIILGAGQVGRSVAAHLAGEAYDITVVDLEADLLRYLQDMRAQEDGPPLGAQLEQILAQLVLVNRIEVHERLVKEKELGLVDERR